MQFGEGKCVYLQIEKGKIMQNIKPISINGLTIKPIEEGDNHKYLGIHENISYNGPNKQRGSYQRMCKSYKKDLEF